MNIDSAGNFSVNGEIKGASLNCSHNHNITDINSSFTATSIPGYNGTRFTRTWHDQTKEEFGRISFSQVGLNQQFGYLYYNTAEPYSIPLGFNYSQIFEININAECNGGLIGTTIASFGGNVLKYWLWCGKNGSFDCAVHYHIYGR